MLKLLALAAAAASASPSTALKSNAPWWETLTVTIASDGQTRGCEYRSSQTPEKKACDVTGPAGSADAGAPKEQYTKLTFERRFRPTIDGASEDQAPTGDTLLGHQVLALAIDAEGAVAGCKIVAKSGDMTPDYGCKEAKTEKFEAKAATGQAREGYMSILVYGHAEELV